MFMPRRSKLEMQMDILKTLRGQELLDFTHIQYQVNICGVFLKKYLQHLMERGLVRNQEVSQSRCKYGITQRGLELLKKYFELKRVLPLNEI
jgi:predicted transcriptional regulator